MGRGGYPSPSSSGRLGVRVGVRVRAANKDLVSIHEPGWPPREIHLDSSCVVGQRLGCGVLIHDGKVTGNHARIVREGDTWRIEDLKSKNGTWVNDVQIESTILTDGDRVSLGNSLPIVRLFPDVSRIGDLSTLMADYEKLRVSHEVSLAISRVLEVNDLLPVLLEYCLGALPTDVATALLLDSATGEVRLKVIRGIFDPADEPCLSATIVERVILRREAILIEDSCPCSETLLPKG